MPDGGLSGVGPFLVLPGSNHFPCSSRISALCATDLRSVHVAVCCDNSAPGDCTADCQPIGQRTRDSGMLFAVDGKPACPNVSTKPEDRRDLPIETAALATLR